MKNNAYFISPHLDDAVFSAGATIAKNPGSTVITVFTGGSGTGITLSARQFLRQLGYSNYAKLFRDRRREDLLAVGSLGAQAIHLGYTDALWRMIPGRRSVLPELNAVYPTYRFHIQRGRVSPHDNSLIKELAAKLKQLVKGDDAKIYCPLGHGGHVDHHVVRQACELAFPKSKLIYWLDFPYSFRDPKVITSSGLISSTRRYPAVFMSAKLRSCKLYSTQYQAVIGDDQTVLKTPETFYVSPATPALSPLTLVDHLYALWLAPKDYLYALISPSSGVVTNHPYNQKSSQDFASLSKEIIRACPTLPIELIGSTGLEILGGGDLDILLPASRTAWSKYARSITKLFGQPDNVTREMIQWKFAYRGRQVDLDLIDPTSKRYQLNSSIFLALRRSKNLRREYIDFKTACQGISKAEYTIRLITFIESRLSIYRSVSSLPASIGKYFYHSLLSPEKTGSYVLAIYQNAQKEQAVVKLYHGHARTRAHHFLQNEIAAYQALSGDAGVTTPRLLSFGHLGSDRLYLMTTFVAGAPLSSLPISKKVQVFSNILTSLHSVKVDSIRGVMSRPPLYWIMLSPVLTLIALIRYHRAYKAIISSFFYILRSSPILLARPDRTYVHRDFSDYNVLKSPRALTLIDLQLVSYGDPLLDYAVVLSKYSLEPDFIKQFTSTPSYKRLVKSTQTRRALSCYLLILSLYDLSIADGNYAQALHSLTIGGTSL